jgi:hypothetical protein
MLSDLGVHVVSEDDSHVVVFQCKHGLHRSVAGARHVAEKLADEGHTTWVLNLGLCHRWWGLSFKVACVTPGASLV